MRIAGSLMARRGVEEGEVSDGGDSLEEITAEDFKHDASRGASSSRVWMGDMMRYPVPRNFAPDLYSFAWAQAVQNKPLGIGALADAQGSVKEESCEVVVEDSSEEVEKEEGELEEGEIELGSEPMEMVDAVGDEMEENETAAEKDSDEIGEFDLRVSLILEELDKITEEEIETSLEDACSRLRKSLESLKQMFSDSCVPILHAIVSQALMRMQTVHSVVNSGDSKKNKDLALRLLIHIKNQYSVLLTSEQLKELDTMANSLVSDNKEGSLPSGSVPFQKPSLDPGAASNIGKAGLPTLETPKSRVEFSPLLNLHAAYDEDSLPSPTRENAPPLPMQRPIGFGTGGVTPGQPVLAKKVESEDKLRPYNRDVFKAVSSYQQKYSQNSFLASTRLPSPTPSEEDDANDDTHVEVSSSSVNGNGRAAISSNLLQLPRVSSSGSYTAVSQMAPVKPFGQLSSGLNSSMKAPAKTRDPRLKVLNTEVGGSLDINIHPMHVNIGGLNSKKHKAVNEHMLDGHALKRPRTELANSKHMQVTPGGRLEENNVMTYQPSDRVRTNETVGTENRKPGTGEISNKIHDSNALFSGTHSGIPQNPSTSAAPAVSLPSLFKEIAVNPNMLMQLIQMEQKRLAALPQQKSADFPPTISSANSSTIKPSQFEQNQTGKTQHPVQTVSLNSQNDVGRLRMKPRDPRRILHNNIAQTCDTMKSEPAKIAGKALSDPSSMDNSTVREQGEQAQTSCTTSLPLQSSVQPDISQLFTQNLKNVANFISTSLSSNTSSAVHQNAAYPTSSMINKVDGKSAAPDSNGQKTPSMINKVDGKSAAPDSNGQKTPSMINKVDGKSAAPDSNGQKTPSGLPSGGGTTDASQALNPWGDVDHLLDGYDDHQKASIQRERARRIEEQSKMFAARKLCLVLDLDHTLLNSAKFMEVDPVHDEILRKKEEQDREKPQRHLYRFQHMGMWTKLRPGVWNFLEKASKLYELHLYTMGNKLYATEMAKVLDPAGTLFSGRVISRGDEDDSLDGDERVPKSKDLDGVLGMESAVVIIDDSVRVWPHNKLNLIVVERYTYFPCSRRQFGLPGPSLLEIDHDERPEAGTLASSLAVIEKVHQEFFSHRNLNDVDVRNILAAEQQKILGGCRILFSRIFPVGEANPHLHPLWQTAEQFGAVCTTQIDDQVTHVVANSLGTDKVNWALSTGRFVVRPNW